MTTALTLLSVSELSVRPGIPNPPTDMTISPTKFLAFTLVCGIPSVVVVALAVRGVIKDRNFLWPLFIVGGALATFVEPVIDYMSGVWWALPGSITAVTLLDVNLPIFVPIVFPWLLGGLAYLAYQAFERGCSTRKLWSLVGTYFLADAVLEFVGMKVLGAYRYYGTQPLDFLYDFPLWSGLCTALGPIAAGALLYVLRPHLRGFGVVMVVGVFPMSFLGVYAVVGFPAWISLNSGWGRGPATLCGLASLGFGYLLVRIIAALVTAAPAPTPPVTDPAVPAARVGR